jgi:hypothetical protein
MKIGLRTMNSVTVFFYILHTVIKFIIITIYTIIMGVIFIMYFLEG